ncbi:MAG: hypothetical protein AAF517_24915 [Planctomycetota bacterium]
MNRIQSRSEGFTLLEISIALVFLSMAAISVLGLAFQMQKQGSNVRSTYASHQVLMTKLAEARLEFSTAAQYLTAYSPQAPFAIKTSQAKLFDSPVATLSAAPIPGSANCVLLTARMTYLEAGRTMDDQLTYVHRCITP